MTQRQITTFVASGAVQPCSRCRQLPKHYHDARRASAGGGHLLECAPCDNRTARSATPDQAHADWRVRNGYGLRTPVVGFGFTGPRPLGLQLGSGA